MKKEDLQKLLRFGEGYTLEFKSSPATWGERYVPLQTPPAAEFS
jgi:hypothetical protein